ncbi:MAG: hydroxyethylthiazole kinase [Candidatus Improbicoccus pseudotrichonymphae]|uniref:Hydroxyethylthiazole kinase n=1 Tax=Candidatus Improbicoccus pseudotrichonymphae TaxID=3033792 RepID=A0AA48IGV9_9FIRM|nr:MAG: hydroxyethylthiazole kinase [Candidatus Improbicoccus pseudotrichonymphae]
MIDTCIDLLNKTKENKPLVHHITNYVTANDCANVTLEIGASPIMADDIEEVLEITAVSDSVVINTGTLNCKTLKSMFLSGKMANKKNIPVIFDPVGVGATRFRNDAVMKFIKEVNASVVRGNISEIKFIAGVDSKIKGVDAFESYFVDIEHTKKIAKEIAQELNCVVAISGAVDVISNGNKIICIKNGHSSLRGLTGTGCMCSSLIGSLCGATKNQNFEATITAMLCMGIAGELAHKNTKNLGNGSFHIAIHNSISTMNGKIFKEMARFYEE